MCEQEKRKAGIADSKLQLTEMKRQGTDPGRHMTTKGWFDNFGKMLIRSLAKG